MNKYLKESGYTKGLEPIDISSDVQGIIGFLKSTNLDYGKKHLLVSRRRLKEETKAFFAEHFSLHNVLVLPGSRAIGFTGLIRHNNDYQRAIETYCIEADPFSIDLNANYRDSHNFTEEETIYDESRRYLTIPYFKAIVLATPFVTTSPCTYAHEIGHTQLDSHYGSITNYHNKEVVSIFLEKLFAYERGKEVFFAMERRRLSMLDMILNKDDVAPEKVNEVIAYIISTLKAEELFDLYVESSQEQRGDIIGMIQGTFDGQMTVEELLERCKITFDSSLDTTYMTRNLTL